MDDLEKYLNIDYSKVPAHLVQGLGSYIENGILPGSFLQALICNNLAKTLYCADGRGFAALPGLIEFLQEKAPSACWGSAEAMELWKARRGIRG